MWRLNNNRAKRGWNLKKLFKDLEVEEDDRPYVSSRVPRRPSVQATNHDPDEEEAVSSAGDEPALSTTIADRKHTSIRGSRQMGKQLDIVEAAERSQKYPDPAEGHIGDWESRDATVKDALGGLETDKGARIGRGRTRGKGKGHKG